MEVGACHDGFFDLLATDTAEAGCDMGDSGPVDEVSTFSSRTDDLHNGGILPVIYPRDYPATWRASVHSIGQRSQIYNTLLEELPKGYGDTVNYEHWISSSDGWSIGKDHTDFRGHAVSMRPGS